MAMPVLGCRLRGVLTVADDAGLVRVWFLGSSKSYLHNSRPFHPQACTLGPPHNVPSLQVLSVCSPPTYSMAEQCQGQSTMCSQTCIRCMQLDPSQLLPHSRTDPRSSSLSTIHLAAWIPPQPHPAVVDHLVRDLREQVGDPLRPRAHEAQRLLKFRSLGLRRVYGNCSYCSESFYHHPLCYYLQG